MSEVTEEPKAPSWPPAVRVPTEEEMAEHARWRKNAVCLNTLPSDLKRKFWDHICDTDQVLAQLLRDVQSMTEQRDWEDTALCLGKVNKRMVGAFWEKVLAEPDLMTDQAPLSLAAEARAFIDQENWLDAAKCLNQLPKGIKRLFWKHWDQILEINPALERCARESRGAEVFLTIAGQQQLLDEYHANQQPMALRKTA